ncbi:MAG: hypothetical protein LBC79_08355 [Deltaproteobacteria bacterium]|nr:hypothetical protein [Deltaproteobacteria bacterium]
MLRDFFTNLLAVCNMRAAARPAAARTCEYCGGGRCIGACGLIGDSGGKLDVCGRLAPHGGEEGRFACDDGALLLFRLDSQAGRDIVSACPEGARCRLRVAVDQSVITAFFSAELLDPARPSPAASRQAF